MEQTEKLTICLACDMAILHAGFDLYESKIGVSVE